MPPASVTSKLAAAAAPGFVLERSAAVPALIGRHQDFLFIAGLGGTACDVGAVTGDGAHVYSLGGAMGAACMMGLGLALARPDKRVLVVTGDGELLMNLGALAAIAVIDPPNLAILCVDNGHYGETGWRPTRISPTGRACCAKATARPSCCCGSSPPSRPSSSATSTPRSAATASAPRCKRGSNMESLSFRGPSVAREPGIHTHRRWLWIPGSTLRVAPE
jgi:hypothetical protein